jgi:hypothetical protein
LGKGNLDRATGPVVAVVIMHQAYINLIKSRPRADHPFSVSHPICISYHVTKEVNAEGKMVLRMVNGADHDLRTIADPYSIGCWSDDHVYNGKGLIKGVDPLKMGVIDRLTRLISGYNGSTRRKQGI